MKIEVKNGIQAQGRRVFLFAQLVPCIACGRSRPCRSPRRRSRTCSGPCGSGSGLRARNRDRSRNRNRNRTRTRRGSRQGEVRAMVSRDETREAGRAHTGAAHANSDGFVTHLWGRRRMPPGRPARRSGRARTRSRRSARCCPTARQRCPAGTPGTPRRPSRWRRSPSRRAGRWPCRAPWSPSRRAQARTSKSPLARGTAMQEKSPREERKG